MSWSDRRYPDDENPLPGFGRPGGDWQGIRSTFDNPFTWAIPVGRVFGIQVRVHLLFLVFIVVELLRAMWATPSEGGAIAVNVLDMAATLACLFVIVLLHEFGHCIGCRWTGGEADEVLMWPLGGLAYCRPPNDWRAHFITAASGPMVNVLICIAAGGMLGLSTGRWLGIALPNPINIFGGFYDPVLARWPHRLLYLINSMSFLLLLFNLLPMFPLDGGRIAQALLWPRFGYVTSMRLACRAGFLGAILLGIFGLVLGAGGMMLVLIAVFGGITCYMTQKQIAFTEEFMGHENDAYALSLSNREDDRADEVSRPGWRARRAERQARKERDEAAEVDRILQKIADTGMDSLSRTEKRLLKKVTDRKRRGR